MPHTVCSLIFYNTEMFGWNVNHLRLVLFLVGGIPLALHSMGDSLPFYLFVKKATDHPFLKSFLCNHQGTGLELLDGVLNQQEQKGVLYRRQLTSVIFWKCQETGFVVLGNIAQLFEGWVMS